MTDNSSKRDGLEKAVYQIEKAIKRSKTNSEVDQSTARLENLLSEAQSVLPQQEPNTIDHVSRTEETTAPLKQTQKGPETPYDQEDDNFAVDDAENPLQLLARASDISGAPNMMSLPRTGSSSIPRHPGLNRDPDLQEFFGVFKPSLDVEEDPVDLGLVTEDEAFTLYAFFSSNLAHTRWGMDLILHTPQFVRKQSTFLFTSIMAASALFMPGAAAISRRLSSHCKLLAQRVLSRRHRSPEIVLAFMVNIPWMAPGKHWSDDETCAYMSAALTIAMDISLDKMIVPSPNSSLKNIYEGREPSSCIAAKKALELDGFPDVDPDSALGRRILRRRERIWLALFVLDRG